ncbi:MAG: sigma factor-like helix-turn-helix DNA-binding protein [Candidatus Izemoplasmatales bacterium]
MENAFDEKIRINGLYDAYGLLLTEKQRRTMEYYYRDDYSLSEIAALSGVSRTAVHELIRVAVGHLEDYEAALGVVRMRTRAEDMKRRLEELGVKDAALARLFEEFDKTE